MRSKTTTAVVWTAHAQTDTRTYKLYGAVRDIYAINNFNSERYPLPRYSLDIPHPKEYPLMMIFKAL